MNENMHFLVAALGTTVGLLILAISALQGKKKKLEEQVVTLDDLEEQVVTLVDKVESYKAAFGPLEENLVEMQAKFNSLNANYNAALDLVQKGELALDAAGVKERELTAEIKSLQEVISKKDEVFKLQEKEITKLKKEAKENALVIAEFDLQIEAFHTIISEITNKASEIEGKNQVLEAQNKAFLNEVKDDVTINVTAKDDVKIEDITAATADKPKGKYKKKFIPIGKRNKK